MASSGKPKQSKDDAAALEAAVAASLRQWIKPGERVLLGLSGGIDSSVLLHILHAAAPVIGCEVRALHVNHQLSPQAGEWARFCRALCRGYGVPLRVARVEVMRGNSTEASARRERFRAFDRVRFDHLVLAHNQDDQAETLLLRLLRGAGVRGLAAMRERRRDERGRWLLRPFLDVPRTAIAAYAQTHGLRWIEDESNDDAAYTRNWLRRSLLPLVAERFPACREALARAAGHLAEAQDLLDELAHIDGAAEAPVLTVSRLRALTPARARNVLRAHIAAGGFRMPETRRLSEALRQLIDARRDAQPSVDLGDCALRRSGDHVTVEPGALRTEEPMGPIEWHGEQRIDWGGRGVLLFKRGRGSGLAPEALRAASVTIRTRKGGERIQPEASRPRRTVKNLLQESGIPSSARERLPFIFCGETLVCIPGVAIDHRYAARAGEASVLPVWRDALDRPTRRGSEPRGTTRGKRRSNTQPSENSLF